ncbi:MAG: outer membrane beta-barrel protein [Devosiaceae bacterium]|nr:outer membrane beta-barrel protein [Devosiaceae bacterium]
MLQKRAVKLSILLVMSSMLTSAHVSVGQEGYLPPGNQTNTGSGVVWTPVDDVFVPFAGDVPKEPAQPFFDVDWSVLLRATHTGGTDTGKNAVELVPEISLAREGLRGQYAFDAQAVLSVNDDQLTRINDTRFGYSGQYELDIVSVLNANLDLTISQGDVNAPGVSDTIVQLPYNTSLRGDLGIVRQFGRFSLGASAQLERAYRGPTQLVGSLSQDNGEFSFVKLGADMRASYAFSPEISLFVEGATARDWYDRAPVATGIKLDGMDYRLSAGAVLNWRNVLSVEASVGQVVRQHIDAAIGDRGEAVYALSFEYDPNQAVSIGGEISTTILPRDVSAGRPRSVAYSASGSVGYAVAPWIGLRATQSGRWVFPDTGINTQTTYTTGFGVDVDINKNLALNLDYLYTWAEILPSVADPEYQHAATIGIRYSR